MKRYALANDLPVYQPHKIKKNPEALKKINQAAPDLNVIVAYGQIIPSSIIYLPKHNSINLHFSCLPKYRGASPIQWALLNGEDRTGVTIFELNEKMDEGPILSQEEIPVLPGENASELEVRLSRSGIKLLIDTIKRIDKITPLIQDSAQATYAPLIKKEDGRIQWTHSALSIERKTRAFFPWPSAFTLYKGKRIKIIRGQHLPSSLPSKNSPGEIISVSTSGIEVCCGDSSIFRIEKLQPENKKVMSAYAFCLGARFKPGDTFDPCS